MANELGGPMTAPLTDAQVAALAPLLTMTQEAYVAIYRNDTHDDHRREIDAQRAQVSALLAERDALKDELRQWRRAAVERSEARGDGDEMD